MTGFAQAVIAMPKFRNVYIAIDISQSMGLGATENDITRLDQAAGCRFGCHVSNVGGKPSNLQIARGANPPIYLRIDAVKDATKDMFTVAKNIVTAKNVKFALYTMQFDHLDSRLSPPSYDYLKASTVANGIDLGPTNITGPGDSDLKSPLEDLAAAIPQSGDGNSEEHPQNFVFIMTDGVRDVYVDDDKKMTHDTMAFDPSWCDAFKKKGVTVGVVYTTYLPFPGKQYETLIAPIIDQVQPNLEKCATSKDYFFEAAEGPEIQQKVGELFQKALGGDLALWK